MLPREESLAPDPSALRLAEISRDTELQAWGDKAVRQDRIWEPVAAGEGAIGGRRPAEGALLAAAPASSHDPMATEGPQNASSPAALRTSLDRPIPYAQLPVQIAHLSGRLGDRGSGSMRLRLDPPHLGEIHLQVEASAEGITVRIVAQSGDACALLADQRNHLKEELGRSGLTLHSFTTSVSADGSGGAHQRDNRSQPHWLSPGEPEREAPPAAEDGGPWRAAGFPAAAPWGRRRGLDTRV